MKLKQIKLVENLSEQGNKYQALSLSGSRISPKIFWIILLFFVFYSKSLSKDIGINFSAVLQPTYLNSQFSLITGGRAGVNLTPELYFGLALYGTTLFKNKVDAIDPLIEERPILELTYYGLDVEYYIMPKNMFHVSLSAFAGWSETFFNITANEYKNGVRYKPEYLKGKHSLIIKPSVNINLNVKHFYRIVLGVSYRYLPGFEYNVSKLVNVSDNLPYQITSQDMNGFAINVAVRLGSFGN